MLPSLLVVGLLVQRSLQEGAGLPSDIAQTTTFTLSTTPGSPVGQSPSPVFTSNTMIGGPTFPTSTPSTVVVPTTSPMVSQPSAVPSMDATGGDDAHHFQGAFDGRTQTSQQNEAFYSSAERISISWNSYSGGCTFAVQEMTGYHPYVLQTANINRKIAFAVKRGSANASLEFKECTAIATGWSYSDTIWSNQTNPGSQFRFVLFSEVNPTLLSRSFAISMNISTTNSTPSASVPSSAASETSVISGTSATSAIPNSAAASTSPVSSGLSGPAKIGLGLGLGLGIPLVIAAVLAAMFALRRKKRYTNDPNYDQYHDMTPSHEDVAAMGYSKGMDASPPLPPLPPQPETTTVAGAGAVAASQLGRLDTSVPPVTPGLGGSPVSPLSHRSSVSSMSTIGPNTRAPTMTSVHH